MKSEAFSLKLTFFCRKQVLYTLIDFENSYIRGVSYTFVLPALNWKLIIVRIVFVEFFCSTFNLCKISKKARKLIWHLSISEDFSSTALSTCLFIKYCQKLVVLRKNLVAHRLSIFFLATKSWFETENIVFAFLQPLVDFEKGMFTQRLVRFCS